MKKLMDIVKDGVLVAVITSSLAGSPIAEKGIDSKFLYSDIFSHDALKPKFSLYIDKTNSKSITYSELQNIVDKVFAEVKAPHYINKAVQMARSYIESANRPDAKSQVGAAGLWQIMELSWYDVMKEDFSQANDTYLNGVASLKHINNVDIYLRQNYPGFDKLPNDEKIDFLNAAYNGGQGTLKNVGWDIEKMPDETRKYVKLMRNRTNIERMRPYNGPENNIIRMDVPVYNR
jgi:hypothetical protein